MNPGAFILAPVLASTYVTFVTVTTPVDEFLSVNAWYPVGVIAEVSEKLKVAPA